VTDQSHEPSTDVAILIPIYEDWEAVALLIAQIDEVVTQLPVPVRVLLIDDGSSTPPTPGFTALKPRNIASIDVVTLRRNLGHQRALAIGLCHVEQLKPSAVIVMDGDGEDAPSDIPRLYQEYASHQGQRAVFAERLRRSEGVVFTVFYHLFRLVHFTLTGVRVRMGNFSLVPWTLLHRLVVVSELWNHYCASFLKARLPYTTVPTVRATRLAGRSRMNFVSLVTHGLSGMSVFSDRIGVRLLAGVAVAGLGACGALALVVTIRFATDLAIPGWATYTTGFVLVLLSQLLVLMLVFVFVVLGSRNATAFIPVRDYGPFISTVRRFFSKA
jgi:polyisoprenyl-phosphate glycosyltransferase